MTSFAALGVAGWLREQCSSLGIREPTPVQVACLPPAIEVISLKLSFIFKFFHHLRVSTEGARQVRGASARIKCRSWEGSNSHCEECKASGLTTRPRELDLRRINPVRRGRRGDLFLIFFCFYNRTLVIMDSG